MSRQKFVFCDDLDSPLLGMIDDDTWITPVTDEFHDWMIEHGCYCSGSLFVLPDQETKVMFLLRWS